MPNTICGYFVLQKQDLYSTLYMNTHVNEFIDLFVPTKYIYIICYEVNLYLHNKNTEIFDYFKSSPVWIAKFHFSKSAVKTCLWNDLLCVLFSPIPYQKRRRAGKRSREKVQEKWICFASFFDMCFTLDLLLQWYKCLPENVVRCETRNGIFFPNAFHLVQYVTFSSE